MWAPNFKQEIYFPALSMIQKQYLHLFPTFGHTSSLYNQLVNSSGKSSCLVWEGIFQWSLVILSQAWDENRVSLER